MPSDRLDGVALVTGGGRGIGASIARELADAGMRVAVTGRTREQIDAVADEIGGLALEGDVSNADDVERWVETAERELGPIELLVANAGIGHQGTTWSVSVEDWWRVFEINVLGVHLSCRAVVPSMLERASGRVVITGSGAAYLPGSSGTAYSASKAAVCRYGRRSRTSSGAASPSSSSARASCARRLTEHFGDDLPWTPPELAPKLVRVLASGRADALAGRYLHAEHDDIDDLIRRADDVIANDLNAIRLQR